MNSNIPKLTDILLEAGNKGFDKLNRMTILHVLTNMATANITIKYNLQGPSGNLLIYPQAVAQRLVQQA